MIKRQGRFLLAVAALVSACAPADVPRYEDMGTDEQGRTFLLDLDSFGFVTEIDGSRIERATILLRRKSGYTEVVHASFKCSEGFWRQNAFAGESEKPIIIPQNWPSEKQSGLNKDHPMNRVLDARCEGQA